ncbi:MAG: sterol desaturase family protein [Betaproteobacteria bacterium]
MKARVLPWMARWIPSAVMLAFVGGLFYLERRRPLRASVDPGFERVGRNFTVGALTALALMASERPVTRRITTLVEACKCGLVPKLRLPNWLATLVTLALLDYTLYLWHILLHRLPFLWRFHLAHHVDLDLDASTALRFHFGEFVLSIPWRIGQIVLIGVTPHRLALWQRLTAAEVLFHHSNLRLPLHIEQALSRVVVTPRLHGIHHSTVADQRDSNYSSGLTVWDTIHGTLRTDVRQADITIGVPPYDRKGEATLKRTLLLPLFQRTSSKKALPFSGSRS